MKSGPRRNLRFQGPVGLYSFGGITMQASDRQVACQGGAACKGRGGGAEGAAHRVWCSVEGRRKGAISTSCKKKPSSRSGVLCSLLRICFSVINRPHSVPRAGRLFGLWSVYFPPSSLGPAGFRINRGLYRGGVLVSMTGYPGNGAPGPGEAF